MYYTRRKRNRKYPVNSVCVTNTEVVLDMFNKLTEQVQSKLPEVDGRYGLPLNTIRVYAVDQLRGRAYWNKGNRRIITIPLWAIRRGEEYLEWYVAHEMAHHYAHRYNCAMGHDRDFMKWLKIICPERSVHHELGYKPRNAAAAGITKPKTEV